MTARAISCGLPRFATIEFNNSDGQVFEAIKRGVWAAGFQIENMLVLDKVKKTFKQIKGEKGLEDVVGHDVIFNLYKPSSFDPPVVEANVQGDLIRLVAEGIAQHLRTLRERIENDPATYSDEHRTTPFLNTMLMNTLIPRGVNVSQLNLPFIEQVCSRYFRRIDGRWYLRNEAVGAENGKGLLIEHEVEISDEVSAIAWLRQQLQERPMMIGEIKPLWFKATAKLAGNLSTQLESSSFMGSKHHESDDKPDSHRFARRGAHHGADRQRLR